MDPLVTLAFALHSNPGSYAILLGSGVSSGAGIPTGWQVVLDLIRRVAAVEGEDVGDDPEAWYRQWFGRDPDYSEMVGELADTEIERNRLLRSYFEPTDEEREQDHKLPGAAHRALAELAARGYIKIFLTTNFDRLLEQALEAAGVTPLVLSTPDAIQGAPPLHQGQCIVVKLHGDYLDTRIRNTPQELEAYEPPVDDLLDRVLDEYGMVVCGWSAEWDRALRRALECAKSRRFTTYWAARGEPGEQAGRLIELRQAKVIPIEDADTFFTDLAAKVQALEEVARPHPLSRAMAVAELKRYLADDRQRIRLRDLVWEEAKRTRERIGDDQFDRHMRWETDEELRDELRRRVERYESATEILGALFAVGSFWAEPAQAPLWGEVLEHVANLSNQHDGMTLWLALRRYPALLLMYAGGVAAVAGDRHYVLPELLVEARFRELNEERPMAFSVNQWTPFERDSAELLPGQERRYTPVSNRLFDVVRELTRDVIIDDARYLESFDRFEYLLGLVVADLRRRAPIGCFHWRAQGIPEHHIANRIQEEIDAEGNGWPPLAAGLFGGSLDRLREVNERYGNQLSGVNWF